MDNATANEYRQMIFEVYYFDLCASQIKNEEFSLDVSDGYENWMIQLRDEARHMVEYYENVYTDICHATLDEREHIAFLAAERLKRIS